MPGVTPRRATVFVLSDVRSGSTLLDQCLGAHPDVVSVGELHWLRAYVTEDRDTYNPEHPLVCTCGRQVSRCPFWNGVEHKLGRPLASLTLRKKLKRRENRSRTGGVLADLPAACVREFPRLYRFHLIRHLLGGTALARDSIALYEAIAGYSQRGVCVDSSKSPYRFRDVYGLDPGKTLAIALVRDFRAVVHSKMKRGLSMQRAACGWRLKMRQIRELTSDLPEKVLRVSYESLCRQPRMELTRVCEFLGLTFDPSMLSRPQENMHHIGGSPSKFDPSRRAILLDESFKGSFSAEDHLQLKQFVGREAVKWGY